MLADIGAPVADEEVVSEVWEEGVEAGCVADVGEEGSIETEVSADEDAPAESGCAELPALDVIV